MRLLSVAVLSVGCLVCAVQAQHPPTIPALKKAIGSLRVREGNLLLTSELGMYYLTFQGKGKKALVERASDLIGQLVTVTGTLVKKEKDDLPTLIVSTIEPAKIAQQDDAIAALIEQLGSAKFTERESAFKALKKLGKAALPLLTEAESHKDAEVATRAKKLTAPYHEQRHAKLAKTLMPSAYPRCPWIYTGSYASEEVFGYLGRAELAACSNGAPDWTRYREATRLYVYNLLREGKSEREVIEVLDFMARAECDWIRREGKNYNPPIELPGEFVPDF